MITSFKKIVEEEILPNIMNSTTYDVKSLVASSDNLPYDDILFDDILKIYRKVFYTDKEKHNYVYVHDLMDYKLDQLEGIEKQLLENTLLYLQGDS